MSNEVDRGRVLSRGRTARRLTRTLAVAIVALVSAPFRSSGADTCPAHLFVIERSKNANVVAYDANRNPNGEWDSREPVVAYWLLNGDKDKREELNRVEREHAYGVEATPGESTGTYSLVFKASRKRQQTVRMLNGCPIATTSIDGHEGILRKIFVKSKEGLSPSVEYVEVFGEDLATGAPLYEKFVPEK